MTGAELALPPTGAIRAAADIRLAHQLAWGCAVFSVVGFLLHLPAEVLWILAVVQIASGLLLQLRAPVLALTVLPAPLLLGPITRLALPGGISIHGGDLFLATLLLGFLLRDGMGARLPLGRFGTLIGCIAVLTLLSWMFSLDVIASAPSMVTLAELFILYLLTIAWVRNPHDVDLVLGGWLAAVTLSSVLVIVSYVRGETLMLGVAEGVANHARTATASVTSLWRATFFVSGFVFPLTGALALCGTWLVTRTYTRRQRALLIASLVINLLATGLMGSATAIGAAAIGVMFLLVWTTRVKGVRRALLVIGPLALAIWVFYLAVKSVMPAAQFALLLRRASSTESLLERFGIWSRVTGYVLTDWKTLLVGLGPDISIRRGDHPLVTGLLYGRLSQQRAVDSGYLYVLLNCGLAAFLLILVTIGAALATARRLIHRERSETAVAIGVMLVIWLIMAITQQLSVSKPAAMAVQVVALTDCLFLARRTHASRSFAVT